jgi:hypothetical protein
MRKGKQPLVFRRIANPMPLSVVPILFTTTRITACRLNVPISRWADPYLRPGRWNGELADSRESSAVSQDLARWQQILKSFAAPLAGYARVPVTNEP